MYKKVTKNDIEFERRGDKIFVEIIAERNTKRADDDVTQNVLQTEERQRQRKSATNLHKKIILIP